MQTGANRSPLQASTLPLVLPAVAGAPRALAVEAATAAVRGGSLLAGGLDRDQGSVSERVLPPRLPLGILWDGPQSGRLAVGGMRRRRQAGSRLPEGMPKPAPGTQSPASLRQFGAATRLLAACQPVAACTSLKLLPAHLVLPIRPVVCAGAPPLVPPACPFVAAALTFAPLAAAGAPTVHRLLAARELALVLHRVEEFHLPRRSHTGQEVRLATGQPAQAARYQLRGKVRPCLRADQCRVASITPSFHG